MAWNSQGLILKLHPSHNIHHRHCKTGAMAWDFTMHYHRVIPYPQVNNIPCMKVKTGGRLHNQAVGPYEAIRPYNLFEMM